MILWDMRTTPRPLGPTEAIRIGTLQGQWPTVLAYAGRPALATAGYYAEYRTGSGTPAGWSAPVIGVDADGQPAAVRTTLPAPPIDIDDPSEMDAARGALAARISTERLRRIALVAGDTDEQISRVGRIGELQSSIQAETATTADRTELVALLSVADHCRDLRAYARVPASPTTTGPALPDAQTLYGWAVAHCESAAALAALSAVAPPVAAPQWPVAAP